MPMNFTISKNFNKALYFLAAAVCIFIAFNASKRGHDFEVFVNAGAKIISGQNIYKPPFAQNLPYYYSPFFALLLSPFSKLPISIVQFCWLMAGYFFLYRIWILCRTYFEPLSLNSKQKKIWLAVSIFLGFRFILKDIDCVQMSVFLLWATLQSMAWFNGGKNVRGAALLSFAINVKLLPVAFVAYLIYRKKFFAAFLCILFYLLFLLIPALYLGWENNIALHADWFHVINPANAEWTIEAEDGPSSLVAMIPVYITDTIGVLSFKRNFVNLPFATVAIILNAVRLIFVWLTLLFLRSMPFTKSKSKLQQFWEISYLFIAVPLIFPHQQPYAFVYIIPAFVYLSWYFITHWPRLKQKIKWAGWILLTLLAFNFSPLIGRGMIGSHFFEVLLYLRVLTFAVIGLAIVLFICTPHQEIRSAAAGK